MEETLRYHPSVMIADESNDTRELLRTWLEGEGCYVIEAANGEEAVKLTQGTSPDLVLMAIRMPGLDGLEATRRIRKGDNESAFPIVCMSTYPTKEAEAQALAAGCSLFIAKPFDFSCLSNLVKASSIWGSERTTSDRETVAKQCGQLDQ